MNVGIGLKGTSRVPPSDISSSSSELVVIVDIGDFREKGGNKSGGNSNEGSCAITISEVSG